MMLKTAVMLLMINGNYTVDVTPIYFQSMEACEDAMPAVLAQVKATRSIAPANATCYEEAGDAIDVREWHE